MAYDSTTKKITAPVSIYDVMRALGEGSTDLGTLCRSGKINMWAKYRPIPAQNATGLNTPNHILTDANRTLLGYGLEIRYDVWFSKHFLGDVANLLNSDVSLGNLSVQPVEWNNGNWHRLTDFVASPTDNPQRTLGYKHDAKPYFQSWHFYDENDPTRFANWPHYSIGGALLSESERDNIIIEQGEEFKRYFPAEDEYYLRGLYGAMQLQTPRDFALDMKFNKDLMRYEVNYYYDDHLSPFNEEGGYYEKVAKGGVDANGQPYGTVTNPNMNRYVVFDNVAEQYKMSLSGVDAITNAISLGKSDPSLDFDLSARYSRRGVAVFIKVKNSDGVNWIPFGSMCTLPTSFGFTGQVDNPSLYSQVYAVPNLEYRPWTNEVKYPEPEKAYILKGVLANGGGIVTATSNGSEYISEDETSVDSSRYAFDLNRGTHYSPDVLRPTNYGVFAYKYLETIYHDDAPSTQEWRVYSHGYKGHWYSDVEYEKMLTWADLDNSITNGDDNCIAFVEYFTAPSASAYLFIPQFAYYVNIKRVPHGYGTRDVDIDATSYYVRMYVKKTPNEQGIYTDITSWDFELWMDLSSTDATANTIQDFLKQGYTQLKLKLSSDEAGVNVLATYDMLNVVQDPNVVYFADTTTQGQTNKTFTFVVVYTDIGIDEGYWTIEAVKSGGANARRPYHFKGIS